MRTKEKTATAISQTQICKTDYYTKKLEYTSYNDLVKFSKMGLGMSQSQFCKTAYSGFWKSRMKNGVRVDNPKFGSGVRPQPTRVRRN